MESTLCLPVDPDFRLIETALWTPEGGLQNAELHLARLGRTASALGISMVDVEGVIMGIRADGPQRVRLTVDRAGQVHIALQAFTPLAEGAVWRIALSAERVSSADPWLRIKTTRRQLYDQARARLPDRADELIFLNERDEVCEGTITNIFANPGQGLVTPPVRCGLLPGVLRQKLLNTGRATEAVLSWDDLLTAQQVYVGNSLRGLIRAEIVLGDGQTCDDDHSAARRT